MPLWPGRRVFREMEWEGMNLDPHGGNVYVYEGVRLDFSVNLNPLGMPEEVLQAVRDHGPEYDRYTFAFLSLYL